MLLPKLGTSNCSGCCSLIACFSSTSAHCILQKKQCKVYLIDFLGKEPVKNTNETAKIHLKQLQSFQTDNIQLTLCFFFSSCVCFLAPPTLIFFFFFLACNFFFGGGGDEKEGIKLQWP